MPERMITVGIWMKRATVEIADDAEDRTAQQEWNLLIHDLSGSESDEERNDNIFANIHDANLAVEKQITVVDLIIVYVLCTVIEADSWILSLSML